MTNIIQHQTGVGEPHASNHGLAAGELAIKQKATNHTTAASGKLYYGEDVSDLDSTSSTLRTFGIGILAGDDADQSQTGVPIGGNVYFKEGSNMTISQGTSGDVVTLTFAATAGGSGDITGVTLSGDSGSAADTSANADLTIAGGSGITTSATGSTVTVAGDNASTSAKGVASFSSDNFAVSSGAVTIKDGGVVTAELAADAVTAAKLADDAVVTAAIVDANVTTGKIADDAVTAAKLASNAVVSASIVDGAIATGDIADDAITAAKLASNAVVSASIVDGAIATADIADDAVTYAKLQNLATADRVLGSTSTGLIGEVQVVADMIATGNVSTSKIADNAVTLDKMASGTDGNLITYDASGNPAYVATGNNDQVLTSNGAGAAPTFQDAAGGGGTGNLSFSDTTMAGNAMTLDSAGEIALDADDNGEVKFFDGGAHYATMQKNSTQGLKLTAGSESKVILTTEDTGILATTGHQWIQAHHFGISNLDNNTPVFLSWASSNSNQSDIANHRPLMPCAGRILKCLITCQNSNSNALATMTNGANDFEMELSGSSTFSDVGHGAGIQKIGDPGRIFENTSNYPVNLSPLQNAVDDGSAGIDATLLGYTWAAGDTIVGKIKNHSGNSNQRASMTMLVEWTV